MATGTSLVRLQEFNRATGEIEVYCERLEQYFIANEIEDDNPRRAAILLSSIDDDTYKLLQDLCFPEKPSKKSYGELVVILTEQLGKKRSLFAERFKFHKAQQDEAEQISDWTARLKRLSTHCGFGTNLDMMLRDRFIVGLKDSEMINRLFKEPESITFARAAEVATQLEIARLHTKEIRAETTNHSGVHFMDKNKQPWEVTNKTKTGEPWKNSRATSSRNANGELVELPNKSSESCRTCGNHHASKVCKYLNYRCRNCNKIGHLARICYSNKNEKKKGDSKCHWNEGETEQEYQIYNLKTGKDKPIFINVNIEGVELQMEVDSGSGVSTISEQDYKKLLSKHKLGNCNKILIGYTQNRDRPLGALQVSINWENITTEGRILVIKNGGPPLCGRDLMSKLGLGIAKINNIKDLDNDIFEEFSEVFKEGIGEFKYGVAQLQLKAGAIPVYHKPRPLPFTMKEIVEKELDRLESEGQITPIESSEWGTPLVPKLKKSGTIRLCGDYKITLNKYLVQVKYPLPRIDEIFAKLEGGTEFTKLDLNQAYNQIKLDEASSRLATWSTHRGLYQVNRLPYGVSPAAAKFQRMIEQTLQGIQGVTSFIDDIIITGRNREEHTARLKKVLNKLQKAGLRLNKNKCQFFSEEVRYLGYIVNSKGLHKDKGRIEAIMKAKKPVDITQVRSFVGMINQYNKFLPNIATVLRPLYDLLKKGNEFIWSEECEDSFKLAKELICSEQVLAHYDPKRPVKLYCDASRDGIGAVLVHVDSGGERPIAFAARTLTKSELNYAMVEKEALAIYYAIRHFHQYLYGRHFILATDHKPLTTIFGEHRGIPTMVAGRLQRWALFLAGYNYSIQHIQGKLNHSADFLSRAVKTTEVQSEGEQSDNYLHFIESYGQPPIDSKQISIDTNRDPQLSRVKEYINLGWPETVETEIKVFSSCKDELTMERRCILWGYRVVVPKKLRGKLLEELHVTHAGIVKTKTTARAYMWWPGIDGEIETMIKGCMACSMTRAEPNKATLIPWQRPARAWERLHLDYLGPIDGKMYLIIIDAYSKWPEVIEVNQATAEQTVSKTREVMARFGLPIALVTDNGTPFTAETFRNFTSKNGIKHIFTAPGHPATNGQAENGVKSFKSGLQKAINDGKNIGVPNKTLIDRYLLGYRNMIHRTTLESPAKLMLGRELRVRLSLIKPQREKTIGEAQERQTRNYRGKRDIEFNKGEIVLVRDYGKINKVGWQEAVIWEIIGPRTYWCELRDGRKWKRHTDQIHKIGQDATGLGVQKGESEFRESMEVIEGQKEDNREITDQGAIDREKPIIKPGAPLTTQSGRVVRPPNRLNW